MQRVSRALYSSSTAFEAPVSSDHGKVSTPDEGDIGRGSHQAAAVEAGDPSDVVPNLVVPDETSGQHLQHELCYKTLCIAWYRSDSSMSFNNLSSSSKYGHCWLPDHNLHMCIHLPSL